MAVFADNLVRPVEVERWSGRVFMLKHCVIMRLVPTQHLRRVEQDVSRLLSSLEIGSPTCNATGRLARLAGVC